VRESARERERDKACMCVYVRERERARARAEVEQIHEGSKKNSYVTALRANALSS
jgi:hypothetical protein